MKISIPAPPLCDIHMELLYLLCSILSTTFTSLILSILLPFRHLFRRVSTTSSAVDAGNSIFLYQGAVWHERRRPVHHSFRYDVRYALIDLDRTRSHVSPDHLSGDEARRAAETNGPVFLLTIPPSVGYEQNPLSVYYCYDVEGSTRTLKKCIAEVFAPEIMKNKNIASVLSLCSNVLQAVTNTPWGERVSFLFNPTSDLVAKPLHVSPFMDMLGNWHMQTNEPGDNLRVVISVQHPELGNYFTASLTAKRVTSFMAGDHALFFWLMPHKVALWIYWHALKLWWKNVSFIQHPRYQTPMYREEALLRDKNIRCRSFGGDELNNPHVVGRKSDPVAETMDNRRFTWRDAKWPWC